MADIPMNGKNPIKTGAFLIIKDIVLIGGIFFLVGLFIDIKSSIAVMEKTVQELVDLHPRTQGGKP